MDKCQEFPEKNQEPKHCARCGNSFGCGVGGKCWCYEISLSPEALKNIEDQYDGCLCPECLQQIANLSASAC